MAKMAYKSKGMKAPRPEAGPAMDQSAPPKHKPSMQHKEPSHPMKPEMASLPPEHKKKALPMQDAPKGASSVNGGSPMALPQSGKPGESDV